MQMRTCIADCPTSWACKAGLALLSFGLAMAGCSQQMPDRAERMTRGYVYYLDGRVAAASFRTGAAA